MVSHGSLRYVHWKCAACLGHVTLESHVFGLIKEQWKQLYPTEPLVLNERREAAGVPCGGKWRSPDRYVMCQFPDGFQRFIDLEVDEDFHEDREVSCELSKHSDTLDGLRQKEEGGTEVVFLRLGVARNKVDKVGKKVTEFCQRLHFYMIERHSPLQALYVDGFATKVGVEYIGFPKKKKSKHVLASEAEPSIVVLS